MIKVTVVLLVLLNEQFIVIEGIRVYLGALGYYIFGDEDGIKQMQGGSVQEKLSCHILPLEYLLLSYSWAGGSDVVWIC